MVYLLMVVAAVVLIAAIAYGTQRKSRDGVASFKRQIDALSPEARKPVVDQVQSVSDLRRSSDTPIPDPGATDPGATDPGATDPGAAEAGAPDPGSNGADSVAPGMADPGSSHDVKAPGPADEPADKPGDSVDGS